MGVAAVFREHYQTNAWGSSESVSGTGSTVDQTTTVRTILPQIIRSYAVSTILDIPCGDFNWMQLVDLPARYIGADIVGELISENERRFSNHARSFIKVDLIADPFPPSDLILCRDCLPHLSFGHISRALSNIKHSGARFLLTTTNPLIERNRDIVSGEWRWLNLEMPPFSLPRPLMLIEEDVPGKCLGLWQISDL